MDFIHLGRFFYIVYERLKVNQNQIFISLTYFRHDWVKSTMMVMWPSGMLPYPHNVLLGPMINPGEGIEPSSSPVVDRHLSLSQDKMSI